jgi:hypothetical protein
MPLKRTSYEPKAEPKPDSPTVFEDYLQAGGDYGGSAEDAHVPSGVGKPPGRLIPTGNAPPRTGGYNPSAGGGVARPNDPGGGFGFEELFQIIDFVTDLPGVTPPEPVVDVPGIIEPPIAVAPDVPGVTPPDPVVDVPGHSGEIELPDLPVEVPTTDPGITPEDPGIIDPIDVPTTTPGIDPGATTDPGFDPGDHPDPGGPATAGGGDPVADSLFDFSIGRPGENNQFSSSQSQQATQLLPEQLAMIQQLLPQFQDLAGQQTQDIQGIAPGLSGSLSGRGGGFLDMLGVSQNPFIQQLAGFQGNNPAPQLSAGSGQDAFGRLAGGGGPLADIAAGQTELQQSLQSPGANPFLDTAIGNIGEDINQQLQRQLVGAGQAGTMSGTRGGSRQGIAEGLMGEAAIRQFANQAGAIRAQDASQQRQLQAQGQGNVLQSQIQAGAASQAGQLGGAGGLLQGGTLNAGLQAGQQGLGLSGLQGAGGLQNQLGGINQGGAGVGLGSLGGMFELGLGQFGAARDPMAALASLFGPILESQASSASSGAGSTSGGFNFGLGL